MKLSLDLNPQDLFGKGAPFAAYWQKSSYPDASMLEVGKEHGAWPKTLGMVLLILLAFYALIEGAQYSVSGRFFTSDLLRGPTYGPVFDKRQFIFKNAKFSQTGKSFAYDISLWRLGEFSYSDIRKSILDSTPVKMRLRLEKYIDYAFYYAQTYQVDPLWVLSIMWVESHFKPQVASRVNAMGLMQLMPGTAHYLNHLLKRPLTPKLAVELSKDPAHNIQLGTYYLGRLLKRFSGNYIYATVSYNMGPGFTRRRLRNGQPVGTRNDYLDKVRRAYSRISRQVRKNLRLTSPIYTQTYAALNRKNSLPDVHFRLSAWIDSQFKENLSAYARQGKSSFKRL